MPSVGKKMSEMVEDNGFKTLENLPVEDVKKVVVVGAGTRIFCCFSVDKELDSALLS
jgi:hypothetical protein